MPPRRDPGGAAAKPAVHPPSEDALKELMETELLLSFLRSRLGSYQQLGDRLTSDNLRLSDELEAQRAALRDVNEFLTNELKARTAANVALDERVASLTARLEETRKQNEDEVSRAVADSARQAAAMSERLEELQRQCVSGQDFAEQRGAQEAELTALRDKLSRQAKEWEARVAALDRQHLADKDRWRREVAGRIRETKMQMAQLADQHLEGTTKRAILENEAMVAELAYHSAQSERLAAANTRLREDAADLRRQASVSKRTAESVARKNVALQRIIKAILARLREDGTDAVALAAAIAVSSGGHGAGAGAAGASGGPGGWGEQQGLMSRASLEVQWGQRESGSGTGQGPTESLAEDPEEGELVPVVTAAVSPTDAADGAADSSPDGPIVDPAVGSICQPSHLANATTGGRPAEGRGPVAARGADSTLLFLTARVAALYDELQAARLALAAASGLASVALPDAAASVAPTSPTQAPAGRGRAPAGGSGGGGGRRSASPAAGFSSGGMERDRGIRAALEDGVAPFVLFAVQQLRSSAARQRNPADGSGEESEEGQQHAAGEDNPSATSDEYLARLLLDLLHSYNPDHTAPFAGLARPARAKAAVDAKETTAAVGGDHWLPGGLAPQKQQGVSDQPAAFGTSAGAQPAATAGPWPDLRTLPPAGVGPLAAAGGALPGVEELLTAAAASAARGGRSSPTRKLAPVFAFEGRVGPAGSSSSSGAKQQGSPLKQRPGAAAAPRAAARAQG